MAKGDGLNDRQRTFVREYLVDLNATQAAIRAGYSEGTAASQSSALLRNPKVAAAVQAGMDKRAAKVEVSADEVLRELKAIGFSDLRKLYDENGRLRNIATLSDDAAKVLAGVETEELWEQTGEGRERVGDVRKVKLWDKLRALELLGKHLKLFTDNVNLSGGVTVEVVKYTENE